MGNESGIELVFGGEIAQIEALTLIKGNPGPQGVPGPSASNAQMMVIAQQEATQLYIDCNALVEATLAQEI